MFQVLQQLDRFDKFVDEWRAGYGASGRAIYCREGCAGCCHMAVHATWPEAVTVAGLLSPRQSASLNSYVERLQGALPELTDLKSYLKRHRQTLGPCPFLDAQGACSIYAARPLSCRALLSTRPATWCTVDFSELDPRDKQAYASSLDRQVVAWPTHYVAATRDFGRELEDRLLESMLREAGWSLSGNFPVLVWLERQRRVAGGEIRTTQQLHDLMTVHRLASDLLLQIIGDGQQRLPEGHRQAQQN